MNFPQILAVAGGGGKGATYKLPYAENVGKLLSSSGGSNYQVYAINIVGNYAYIAHGSRGLAIVDISDATTPSQVGSYILSNLSPTWWPCRASAVIGNTLAFCNRDTSGRIESIDISTPASPVTIDEQIHAAKFSDLVTDGTSWFVAGQISGIFKYSNTDPMVLMESNTSGSWETQGIEQFSIDGAGYILSSNYRFGVRISLASDLSNVGSIGKPTMSNSEDLRPWKGRVKQYGTKTYAFFCGNDNEITVPPSLTGLAVLDISDPSSPSWVGVTEIKTGGDFEWLTGFGDKPDTDIAIYGDHAFISHGSVGIAAFNISDPENCKYLGILGNDIDTYLTGQKDNLSALTIAEISGDVYIVSGDGVHNPLTDGTDQIYIDKVTFL